MGISQENNVNQFAIVNNNEKETYSSVLTRTHIHQEPSINREEDQRDDSSINKQKTNKQNKYQREEGEKSKQQGEELRYRFEFSKLLLKLKNVFTSEVKLEEKVVSVLKIIWQELLKILGVRFSKGEFIEHFFSFLNG